MDDNDNFDYPSCACLAEQLRRTQAIYGDGLVPVLSARDYDATRFGTSSQCHSHFLLPPISILRP